MQGVAGAGLSPATLTIIVTTFSGDRRTRALGIWSAVAGGRRGGRLDPGRRPHLRAVLAVGAVREHPDRGGRDGRGFGWLSAIGPHSSYWTHVFGPGGLIALALGLLFTPLAAAATSGVAVSDAGLAAGVPGYRGWQRGCRATGAGSGR